MNTKLINFIIAFSLVGITFVFISDYFNQSNGAKQNYLVATSASPPSPTITPKPDPTIACQNDFFNFQKGTSWRYKLVWGEKKKSYFFTNEIIESSTSSAVVETKFDNDTQKTTTKIVCRQSGLFGYPYPLFPPEIGDKSNEQNNFLKSLKMNSNVFFLPSSSSIKKGGGWKSELVVEPGIPFVESVTIEIENKIKNVENKPLFGRSRLAASLESFINKIKLPLDLIKPPKESVIQYVLVEEIGISSLKLNFSMPDLGSLKSELTLLNFKSAPISSSQ